LLDFGDITTDRSGVNAGVWDLGVLGKNSRCVFASRRIVG